MEKGFVCIETYGCSSNSAESQVMAGVLERSGYEIVRDVSKANIIIINSCSVKMTTINKIIFRIAELREKFPEKDIIISGCLVATERDELDKIKNLRMVSNNNINHMADFIESNNKIMLDGRKEDILCKPRSRGNEIIAIVPICTGCNSCCSFCATKLARGSIFSYPGEKILKEISSAKKFGAKEFWITGQDVSAYGLDSEIKSSLPQLLETICENVEGKYFLRVGMLNPANVREISNELLKSFRHGNIFKFIHMPVQSGSDQVLKKMNRKHNTEEFLELIEKFRRHYPEITVWTDVIVGFPEETDEDFQKTMKLIESLRPDFVNLSQFSSHKKTAAHQLKQVPSDIKKSRSRLMTSLVQTIALEKNKKWLGWKGEVLIDEYKSNKKNYIARNFAYKPIVLRTREKLAIGSFVNAEIIEARHTCLIGIIKS